MLTFGKKKSNNHYNSTDKNRWKLNAKKTQNSKFYNDVIGKDQCGIFFTIKDGEQQRATREGHSIINTCLDELSQTSRDVRHWRALTIGGVDISDSLRDSCKINYPPSSRWTHIRTVETGSKNSIFFIGHELNPQNIYKLSCSIVNKCQTGTFFRFLARVVPVEKTCSALPDQFIPTISEFVLGHLEDFIKKRFGKEVYLNGAPCEENANSQTETPPISYSVDFVHRNSEIIKRQKVYNVVADVFKANYPNSKVDLSNADILYIIQIIRNIALLGCVCGRDYIALRKYALHSPFKDEKEDSDRDNPDEKISKMETTEIADR